MKNYRITNVDIAFGNAHFDIMTIAKDDTCYDDDFRMYHSHGFYEIFLVRDMSKVFAIGNKEVVVNSGEMIIVGKNCEHIAGINGGDYPYSALSVALEKRDGEKGFYKYYRDILDSYSGVPVKLPDGLFKRIDAYKKGFCCDSISEYAFVKSDISCILAELFFFLKGNRDDSRCYNNSTLHDKINLGIDELVNGDMLLSDIAKTLGYSERHTSRLITRRFGKNLTEIRKERMRATAEKIKNGNR